MLELTRYIHLKLLRAGIVEDLSALDDYRFAGHSVIMGNQKAKWQDDGMILKLFARTKKAARRQYREFVEKGIEAGRRPELVGGGLVRSVGGWKKAKIFFKGQDRIKGDERIMGDIDFFQQVLDLCNELKSRQYRLESRGVDLAQLAQGVAEYFNVSVDRLFAPGRYPVVVQARRILCFLAARELGVTGTELARQMGLTQPAISMSVNRGERLVKEKNLSIDDFLA